MRSVLLAWLDIRALCGTLVLRIEDVDRGRCRTEFEAAMIDDLRWLGLDWDEGPDVGGPFGPYRQSERDDHFAAALAKLDSYPCSCTRRELHETSPPDGREPIYSGRCRHGDVRPQRALAFRWRAPDLKVVVDDEVYGLVVQNLANDAGDFILRRSDGAYAYQLAVVVDDAAMEITRVVRGAEFSLHATMNSATTTMTTTTTTMTTTTMAATTTTTTMAATTTTRTMTRMTMAATTTTTMAATTTTMATMSATTTITSALRAIRPRSRIRPPRPTRTVWIRVRPVQATALRTLKSQRRVRRKR